MGEQSKEQPRGPEGGGAGSTEEGASELDLDE